MLGLWFFFLEGEEGIRVVCRSRGREGVYRLRVVWCCVLLCFLLWCGVVWCCVVLCGVVLCGVVLCGVCVCVCVCVCVGVCVCGLVYTSDAADEEDIGYFGTRTFILQAYFTLQTNFYYDVL